jgi:hypothetical protein
VKHDYIETHLAKHEYIEGPQALENFKRLARTVFQAKKTSVQAKPKKAAKKTVRHKPSGKDKA